VAGSTAPMPWLLIVAGAVVIVAIEMARLAWKK
jgi:hypothetical protein